MPRIPTKKSDCGIENDDADDDKEEPAMLLLNKFDEDDEDEDGNVELECEDDSFDELEDVTCDADEDSNWLEDVCDDDGINTTLELDATKENSDEDAKDEDAVEEKDDMLVPANPLVVVSGWFGNGAINVLVMSDQWLCNGIMATATTNASDMINNHDTPGIR